MLKSESCKIIDEKECDVLYQATYHRVCKNCGREDTKDRHFTMIMKNGHTMDIDNWHCPNCGQVNMTSIISEK